MLPVPILLNLAFILLTIVTVLLFYKASHNSKKFIVFILVWLTFVGLTAYSGFFAQTGAHPPLLGLVVFPTFVLMLFLFNNKKGKSFIDSLDIRWLTILHTIRIPVEIGLFYLFVSKMIPIEMTFEGRNFDILAGITAPLVYYLVFVNRSKSKKSLLIWNILFVGFLINIIVTATLSIESPLQQFGFEQPNIGVLHFPFIWLPSCIVPIVMFSHFAAIRQCLYKTQINP